MKKRRQQRETVSLKSFLRTGELGPLKLGATMQEVAEQLGPPDHWMADGHAGAPVPLLWFYGNWIEVHFELEAPCRVRCIKLRRLPQTGRRSIQIRPSLWIATDGIHKEIRLSELLRMSMWPAGESIVVGVSRNWNTVIDANTDKVRLVWHAWGDDETFKEAERLRSRAGYIALRDQLSTGFHGVYSIENPRDDRAPLEDWENFSVADYLALMEG